MNIRFGVAGSWWPLLAATAGTVIVLAGCTVSTGGSGPPPPAGSSTQAASSTYNLPAGMKTLTVDNPIGDVHVTGVTGSSQIHVVQRPAGRAIAYRNVTGSAATIGARCPAGIQVGIHTCHMDYQVQMPPSAALNVVDGAGDITLQGQLAEAQAKTGAGDVSGTGLGRGSFTVATGAGDVSLTFSSAPARVKVTTGVGGVNVTVPGSASYRVSASSGIGTKNIKVPSNANAVNVIDLHAGTGDISLRQG